MAPSPLERASPRPQRAMSRNTRDVGLSASRQQGGMSQAIEWRSTPRLLVSPSPRLCSSFPPALDTVTIAGLPARPTHLPPRRPVYQFRPFRNTDPPHLAEIWRNQPPQRGVMQPMSAGAVRAIRVLEAVLRSGRIDRRARDDNVPVGFVHAGFGPNDEQNGVATEMGTTYLLMLAADANARSPTSCSPAQRRTSATAALALTLRRRHPTAQRLLPRPVRRQRIARRARHRSHTSRGLPRNGYREIDRVIILPPTCGLPAAVPAISGELRRTWPAVKVIAPVGQLVGGVHDRRLRADRLLRSIDSPTNSCSASYRSGTSSRSRRLGHPDRRHVRFRSHSTNAAKGSPRSCWAKRSTG